MTDLIITGARAPVAIDLGRAARAAGLEVRLADSLKAYAARALQPAIPFDLLPSPRQNFSAYRGALCQLLERYSAAKILPTCEEVFWLAEAAARDGWSMRLLAPDTALLRRLHSKADFIGLAKSLGIDTPETSILDGPFRPGDLPRPLQDLVFKPEFSRFATYTLLAPDLISLQTVRPQPSRRWVVQERIIGEEICSWAYVECGHVMAFAAYRPRWRMGHSAAYQIEAMRLPAVRQISERIAKATCMTGHLSFDLIIEESGRVLPIECNPRAVSGLHLYDASAELGQALCGQAVNAEPESGTLRHMTAAMALLGLPKAAIAGKVGPFIKDWRDSQDVIDREHNPMMTLACLADAGRFAWQGWRSRQSPAGATTADIEWDGEAIA